MSKEERRIAEVHKTTIEGPLSRPTALRRKMLDTAGVDLPRRRQRADVEEIIRDTFVECVSCATDGRCRVWLENAKREMDPPEFCANRERILTLRSLLDGS